MQQGRRRRRPLGEYPERTSRRARAGTPNAQIDTGTAARSLRSSQLTTGPQRYSTTTARPRCDHYWIARISHNPDSDDVQIECTLLCSAYHFISWRSGYAGESCWACAIRGRRGVAIRSDGGGGGNGGDDGRQGTKRSHVTALYRCWMRVARSASGPATSRSAHATPSIIGTHSLRPPHHIANQPTLHIDFRCSLDDSNHQKILAKLLRAHTATS